MARIIRTGTSRGAHIRALYSALSELEQLLPEYPSHRRVALRDHRAALQRAYPQLLLPNETELAQALAEEDGDAVTE